MIGTKLLTHSTVVGIPTRDEAATVAAVARTADAGLRLAFPAGHNAVVLADNGSTDGTVDRFRATPLAADPGQTLLMYTAEHRSPSEDSLRMLASWAASEGEGDASNPARRQAAESEAD